ncbi:type VII secretion target [Actinoplanes sp. NPDC023936]|uniref:type VII secretion target n=1 Tax=Actinoplanes sp. NPDC023936 TaxID=3154910 RepID=UPI00340CA88A
MRADPAELRRHASCLDAATEALERARDAGDDTGITPDAYGHLCVVVPALLDQARVPLVAAIGAAARAAGSSADAVRRAAGQYQLADETAADGLWQAGGFR